MDTMCIIIVCGKIWGSHRGVVEDWDFSVMWHSYWTVSSWSFEGSYCLYPRGQAV